jgi:alanine-synthesizing transaminase
MKFSSRLPHGIQPNALSLLLDSKRRAGVEVLDLTESNPTRAGIVYPEGFLDALSDPRAATYEPEPFGLPAAREFIAQEFETSSEYVVMTASTSEAYSWLFKLLCDPGDEILVPRPSYPLFEYLAALESAVVRHYSLFYDHGSWCIDFHTIRQALNERTRAIVVVNPNNPTGNFIQGHELKELAELCEARGIAIISDEVFRDYVTATTCGVSGFHWTIREHNALTFSLHGLSKSVGLPQMKLAWMIVSGPDALVREAMQRLEMIADTYLSVGTPVQFALPALLALREPVQQQIMARIHENSVFLFRSALSTRSGEAGWYAIVKHSRGDDFAEALLRDHNLLVQPGYFYDFEGSGYLVLSLLTKPEVFREGVTRLRSEFDRNPRQSSEL